MSRHTLPRKYYCYGNALFTHSKWSCTFSRQILVWSEWLCLVHFLCWSDAMLVQKEHCLHSRILVYLEICCTSTNILQSCNIKLWLIFGKNDLSSMIRNSLSWPKTVLFVRSIAMACRGTGSTTWNHAAFSGVQRAKGFINFNILLDVHKAKLLFLWKEQVAKRPHPRLLIHYMFYFLRNQHTLQKGFWINRRSYSK